MRPSGNVRDFYSNFNFFVHWCDKNLCDTKFMPMVLDSHKKIVHLTAIKFNVAHLLKCLCQPVSSFMASLNLGLVVDSYIESLMLNLKVKPV